MGYLDAKDFFKNFDTGLIANIREHAKIAHDNTSARWKQAKQKDKHTQNLII